MLIKIIDANNRQYCIEKYGFLKNSNDWGKDFVFALADKNKLMVTNKHWDIIHYLHKNADGVGAIYALQLLWINLNIKCKALDNLFVTTSLPCFEYRSVCPDTDLWQGLLQACLYANIYVDKIIYNGNIYQLDCYGELFYPNRDWTLELASEMAARDGLVLTSKHREVISYLNQFYQANAYSPVMRELKKIMLSDNTTSFFEYIYSHFNNFINEACYLAGNPRSSGQTKLRRFKDCNGKWWDW